MRRALAIIVSLALALAMGVMSAKPAAAADPVDWVTAIEQTTSPEEVVFGPGDDALPVRSTLTLAEPANWQFDKSSICVDPAYDPMWGFITCSPSTAWLDLNVGDLSGNERTLTITGEIPNYDPSVSAIVRGYVGVMVTSEYTIPVDEWGNTSAVSQEYFYIPVRGETNAEISGPVRINTGASLTLTGEVECYLRSAYGAPPVSTNGWDYPMVDIEFREDGGSEWRSLGQANYNVDTGGFRYFNLSVGATGDWRAHFTGAPACQDVYTSALRVVAGAEEPPPPPATSNAPAMVVSKKTHNTVSLDWAAPTQPNGKVEAYRIGWSSANGLPAPEWSRVYTADEMDDPFTMTNLSAENEYTMWIEAITPAGTGDRTTVRVTTNATPPPPPKPPVKPKPVVKAPGTPRATYSRTKTTLTLRWAAPAANGKKIDRYQVKRTGKSAKTVSASKRSYKFTKLKAGKYYTLSVRAHNAKGYSAWKSIRARTVPKAPKPPKAKTYQNCAALTRVYPHGVGKPGAVDDGGVTNFYRSTTVYNKNKKSDRDKDGVACER